MPLEIHMSPDSRNDYRTPTPIVAGLLTNQSLFLNESWR